MENLCTKHKAQQEKVSHAISEIFHLPANFNHKKNLLLEVEKSDYATWSLHQAVMAQNNIPVPKVHSPNQAD
jgi:hypothetical protein